MGVLCFNEVARQRPATLLKKTPAQVNSAKKKKKSRKSSIVDVQLGSKYALASGRYW